MQLQQVINNVFEELSGSLQQLEDAEYTGKCSQLSGASVGQHTRHIIELFQCLLSGYAAGTVNYDERRRDTRIETDKSLAIWLLQQVGSNIALEDKPMRLISGLGHADALTAGSSYLRELVYNLEHAIHHMALIRVGIQALTNLQLPDTFGVAPATVQYRKTCAQ